MNTKEHWENIYQTKQLNEVSWFQQKPETSLRFFETFSVPKNAKIIDVGGGDSYLVDNLLELGYQDVSVLDISKSALDRAKQRLGDKAKWIEANAAHFRKMDPKNAAVSILNNILKHLCKKRFCHILKK